MMYLISKERLKQFADLMRSKTGETKECSLEEIKNKLESVRTENDFLKLRGCYLLFSGFDSLTTIPQLDTSLVYTMMNMFSRCTSLTTIQQLDIRSLGDTKNMFRDCKSLTNCYLKNIKTSLTIGSATSYGHLLKSESLLYMIKELVNTGSSNTLTMGAANRAKLSSTYVKLIDITDEMRSEDDLIDSKLPFEVCESADEGALNILTDYVALKNWSIK